MHPVAAAGSKAFISGGGAADVYLVMARTSQQPGAKGISAFLVDKVRLSMGLKIARSYFMRRRGARPHPALFALGVPRLSSPKTL